MTDLDARHFVTTSCTTGAVNSGEAIERLRQRGEQNRLDAQLRGIVCLHGAGNRGQTGNKGTAPGILTPADEPGIGRLMFDACRYAIGQRYPHDPGAYTAICPEMGGDNTWGNDTAMSQLDALVDAFTGTTNPVVMGATGNVALMGVSMGACNAVNYALRHRGKVAGLILVNPVLDLAYHYHGGVEGSSIFDGYFPNEINTAYALPHGPPDANNATTLNAAVKTQRDPLTRAAELAGLPIHVFYDSDDTVVNTSSAVPAFSAAVGASCVVHSPGTGGHFTNPTLTGQALFAALEAFPWSA